jgi:hypothetical protein
VKNITLAIDDETLAASREYAQNHGTTVNALVRQLLERTVREDSKAKIEELFRLMDEYPGDSQGWRWNREEIYER